MGKSRDISKVLNNEGLVDSNDLATGAAAANLGSYVSQVNGQSGSVTVEIPPSFASGTVLIFGQTNAPTGWTKDTTNFNNSALRVVTGTVGSGGTQDFTTAFASQTPAGTVSVAGLSVGSTTLTTAQIPSHAHGIYYNNGSGPITNSTPFWALEQSARGTYTINSEGGGSSHTHSVTGSASFTGTAINLAVKYVDVIRATKN